MSNPAFIFDHIHIISQAPKAAAEWYMEMFGARIAAETVARGAAQIFLELGGKTIIIRGQRPGEAPRRSNSILKFEDFSSHNEWGIDHFGFMVRGDLEAFCATLRGKGVTFPVELKRGVDGSLLCYVSGADGVSIELMQC